MNQAMNLGMQNSYGAATKGEGPLSEIQSLMQRLERLIGTAEDSFGLLHDRISPILQSHPPESTADKVPVPREVVHSTLGGQLDALALRLENHTSAIAAIQSRCRI